MMWTVDGAAVEFGSTDETVSKGLRANNIEVLPRKKYTTKQIFCALSGDLKFERTRRERIEADKAEAELAILQGSLLDTESVTKFIQRTFSPFRERLMGMPGRLAAQLNLTPEQRKAVDA